MSMSMLNADSMMLILIIFINVMLVIDEALAWTNNMVKSMHAIRLAAQ